MKNSLRALIITTEQQIEILLKRRSRQETRHSIGAKANNSTTGPLFDSLVCVEVIHRQTRDNAFLILVYRARLLHQRIIVMRVPEVSSYSRDLTPARRSLCYVNRDSSPASDDFHPSKLIFVMRAHIALLKKDCRESGGGGVRARSLRAA